MKTTTTLSLSLLFYCIVYAFYSSFLTPQPPSVYCVCVCLKMPGFFGNVFLAALKCLTYFISSKTFCKYLLVRIHLKYCLERDSQTCPELTTPCLCPGSQEKEIQSSSWSMGGKEPLVHFVCFCVHSVCKGQRCPNLQHLVTLDVKEVASV